jgi:hypothetical protein
MSPSGMPGSIPKGILKSPDRDKKLPAVPPISPNTMQENTRINCFIPSSASTGSTPRSSKFHPKPKPMAGIEELLISESHFMKSSSMYTVNEYIDQRPWIRGGSSSAVSYLL